MSNYYGAEAYDRHEQDEAGKTLLLDELWTTTPSAGNCVICLSKTGTYPNVCGTCIRMDDDNFSLALALVAGPYGRAPENQQRSQQRKAALSARNDYALQRY